jgi:uncharacterized membrane protein YqhA
MSRRKKKTAMDFVDRIISQTRYMVIVAVVASLALAATLFLFGAVAAARIIAGTVGALGDAKQTKAFAIASVEIFSSQRPCTSSGWGCTSCSFATSTCRRG